MLMRTIIVLGYIFHNMVSRVTCKSESKNVEIASVICMQQIVRQFPTKLSLEKKYNK